MKSVYGFGAISVPRRIIRTLISCSYVEAGYLEECSIATAN
jgi:hypothetical protein